MIDHFPLALLGYIVEICLIIFLISVALLVLSTVLYGLFWFGKQLRFLYRRKRLRDKLLSQVRGCRSRGDGVVFETKDLEVKDCAICLEALDVVDRKKKGVAQISACKHLFHVLCIVKWGRSCPICRVDFDQLVYVNIG